MFRGIRRRLLPEAPGYSAKFFAKQQAGSRLSAEVIVPIVLSVVHPRNAIDVGCGVGTWAAVLAEHGVDVLGIDGDYVPRAALQIPSDRFRSVDLRRPPYPQLGRFELAICLEVAEHLPEAVADRFVAFLAGLSPIILFGAAIPGQGGHAHINEQWQGYWIAKFRRHGLYKHDVVRPAVWTDTRVKPWYAQNTFLFSYYEEKPGAPPTDLVHPMTFLRRHGEKRFRASHPPAGVS